MDQAAQKGASGTTTPAVVTERPPARGYSKAEMLAVMDAMVAREQERVSSDLARRFRGSKRVRICA